MAAGVMMLCRILSVEIAPSTIRSKVFEVAPSMVSVNGWTPEGVSAVVRMVILELFPVVAVVSSVTPTTELVLFIVIAEPLEILAVVTVYRTTFAMPSIAGSLGPLTVIVLDGAAFTVMLKSLVKSVDSVAPFIMVAVTVIVSADVVFRVESTIIAPVVPAFLTLQMMLLFVALVGVTVPERVRSVPAMAVVGPPVMSMTATKEVLISMESVFVASGDIPFVAFTVKMNVPLSVGMP